MTAPRQLRRLEQWMTFIRWTGVVFGVIGVSVQPNFPDVQTERQAWVLVAILAIGSLIIWGAMGRLEKPNAWVRLGLLAYAFDIAIVFANVWVFAYERPYVTWALMFLIPMEGALRYRLKGAIAGAVLVAAFFVPQSLRRADLLAEDFDIPTYVFAVGMSALVAGITGSMAENWQSQTLAFETQSMKLTELDQLKDRFLAVTSHEIRGPLAAIITGIDTVLQKGDRLTEDQRGRLLEIVSLQSHQLARLVDDLMITSQVQAGGVSLQPEMVDLQPTVDQALEAAASKRRAHQLEVFVDPLQCEIDSGRVGQIVRNLVENAYKYTPDRTRVAVTGKAIDSGVELAVADDGPGIPADQREKLFEAFSQMENVAAGRDGVGLGLFVVSHLVMAMEGRIDLKSSSRGTTFTIFVPCRRISPEPALGLVEEERASR